MYYSRQFWKDATLENTNPDSERTVTEKYITSYNRNTKRDMSVNYININKFDELKEEIGKVEQKAKELEIGRLSVSLRQTDEVQFDEAKMESLGLKKVVELSKCGMNITEDLINNLSTRTLPEGYISKEVDYDYINSNPQIHKLINDNFPDGFTSSPEEAKQILGIMHKSATHKNSIELFFVIEKDGEAVGLSSGTISTQGKLKNVLHLGMGVVDKPHRKKGLYKELLRLRMKSAKEHGAKFAYTESDVTTSRPILERLGLQEFDRVKIFHKNL